MRLLNAKTRTLEDFNTQPPPYAILSHTWGQDEVIFQDLLQNRESSELKAGYQKIRNTCDQALKDGWQYAWIDTYEESHTGALSSH